MVVDPQASPSSASIPDLDSAVSPDGSEPYRRTLQDLCETLRRRGRDASLAIQTCAGDADIRLRVPGDAGTGVEVLGPYGDGLPEDSWYAVRITPGDRAVWRGPSQRCPHRVLLRFVEDLLASNVGEAARRTGYVRLG